jgi:hypothetical protein
MYCTFFRLKKAIQLAPTTAATAAAITAASKKDPNDRSVICKSFNLERGYSNI